MKQQPIKDDVNDSCQLKKQSSLTSSSSHTSYVSDDNNIIFEDKRCQSTVEDTERKSHGHNVAPVMVTADKSILSVFLFYVALVDYLWIGFEFMNLYKYFINDFKHF